MTLSLYRYTCIIIIVIFTQRKGELWNYRNLHWWLLQEPLLRTPQRTSYRYNYLFTVKMMRLQLNNNNSHLLSTLEHDVNLSTTTKVDVFNFLCIVIKNLMKVESTSLPNNEDDDVVQKYRQLRLQNVKIQRYIATHSSVLQYLQQVIGFERIVSSIDDKEETLLRIVSLDRLPSSETLQEQLKLITAVVHRLGGNGANTKAMRHSGSTSSIKSSSSSEEVVNKNSSDNSSDTNNNNNNNNPYTKLTEKQKARLLMEEKIQQQKLRDEQERKRTIQQIQNDKFVRQNDPNWKPNVSAAAAKSGTSMQTFRDKFGEN